LFAVRQDIQIKGSVQEEEIHGESEKAKASAEEAVGKAHSYTQTAIERTSDKEEAAKGMCKHARVTVHKADGLSSQDSSIDPYVKVTYKTKQNADSTFQTKYEKNTANPTWNHVEEVLLCDKMAPMRFAVYDKNWVMDTLLAEAELDANQFWQEGFSDKLLLEGGNKGLVHVTIES